MKYIIKKSLLVILFLFLINKIYANSYTVTTLNDAGPGSLRQAIIDANMAAATPGSPHTITFTVFDTIKLASSLPDISNHMVIDGASPGNPVVISGENQFRIVYIASGTVTFSEIIFTKGKMDPIPPATFSSGGAIYNAAGTCIVSECEFNYNAAISDGAYGGHGGAIYNEGSCVIVASFFSNNFAISSTGTESGGGAIYTSNNYFSVSNTIFTDNQVAADGYYKAYGGAIFIESGPFSIESCTFTNNSAVPSTDAGAYGGAVYNHDGVGTLLQCNFTNNHLQNGYGAAFFNDIGTTTVDGCIFSNNITSTLNGGAIHNESGFCTVLTSTFNGNKATNGSGGAIYSALYARLFLKDSYFQDNHSSDIYYAQGGAVYSDGTNDTIVSSTFENNTTNGYGGAVFVNSVAAIFNSTFTHNSAAQNGGAISVYGDLVVNHSTFFGNVTPESGGGIFIAGSLNLNNSIVAGDTSSNNPDGYEDIFGIVNSDYGHNIFGDPTGITLDGVTTGTFYNVKAEDVINVTLADNGGATKTHALVNCSFAINAGVTVPYLSSDQRGNSYSGAPDIGAFESNGSLHTAPASPVASIPPSYCASEVIANLTATGSNIKWYSNRALTNLVGSGNSLNISTIKYDTVFYVTQTDANACKSYPAVVPVVVEPIVNITFDDPNPIVCQAVPTYITAQGDARKDVISMDGDDDRILVPVMNSVIPVNNESYTIELWINPYNNLGYQGIIGWGDFNNGHVTQLRIYNGNLYHGWGGGNEISASISGFNYDWHHVAATYDGTTRKLFFDGTLVNSDVPSGSAAPSADRMEIGSANFEYFWGKMAEIRIWNVAKTAAELQASMNHKINPTTSNLVSYWRGSANGKMLTDFTGNGNDGYFFNGPYVYNDIIYPNFSWSPTTGLDDPNAQTVMVNISTTTVYTVTASYSRWLCSSSKDITATFGGLCLGTNDPIALGSLQVVPNPSEGNITIKMNGSNTGLMNCVIQDVTGKVIYKNTINKTSSQDEHKVDLTGVNPGVYFLSIGDDQKKETTKLIIK